MVRRELSVEECLCLDELVNCEFDPSFQISDRHLEMLNTMQAQPSPTSLQTGWQEVQTMDTSAGAVGEEEEYTDAQLPECEGDESAASSNTITTSTASKNGSTKLDSMVDDLTKSTADKKRKRASAPIINGFGPRVGRRAFVRRGNYTVDQTDKKARPWRSATSRLGATVKIRPWTSMGGIATTAVLLALEGESLKRSQEWVTVGPNTRARYLEAVEFQTTQHANNQQDQSQVRHGTNYMPLELYEQMRKELNKQAQVEEDYWNELRKDAECRDTEAYWASLSKSAENKDAIESDGEGEGDVEDDHQSQASTE
jgi:hypothetical protein